MTIVITGGSGQLGSELSRQLGDQSIRLSRRDLDITSGSHVDRVLQELRPEVVVNAAAYTQVDRAEEETEPCREVNVEAVDHLARACQSQGAVLVHVSSDYVFDGYLDHDKPWTEQDIPRPTGAYALSKFDGETAAARCQRHFVVRTCGLYGMVDPPGQAKNFVETMLRLSETRDHLRVVNDQRCTPSSTVDIARAILFLIGSDAYGLYHVTNVGETTWHAMAEEIFRLADIEMTVEAISSEEYAAAAPRPRYSVLSTAKYEALGGPALPDWQTALASYLAARPQ